jgi:hypothetical protein
LFGYCAPEQYYGESAVFLSDGLNYEMFYRMGADVFATDPDVKQLLMGYLECYGSYASAFFCLVEKAMDDRPRIMNSGRNDSLLNCLEFI